MPGFRNISTIPSHTELIDIILNKTQRKTPTQLHAGEHISKARVFYTKKVRYINNQLTTRLSTILNEFPAVDTLHPFYTDLFNILFDKSCYKQSLAHISVSKTIATKISNESLKLIKYAETHYRAKQLKRACFGRLSSLCLKLKDTLKYLEEVRQQTARLPNIDPTQRTLLLAGHPNVGKSSFINEVSRAFVDVQPYAFTTKNLFVGHFDYDFLKWQIVDTPGVLDHKIEERNLIEMQAITALAHVKACVLFLVDLSTTCGFSISEQVTLCEGLEPLLGNVLVVLSKVDAYYLKDSTNPAAKTASENGGAELYSENPSSYERAVEIPTHVHSAESLLGNTTESSQRPNSDACLQISPEQKLVTSDGENKNLVNREAISQFVQQIDHIDTLPLNEKSQQLQSVLSKVETLRNDPSTLSKLTDFLSKRRFTAMSAQSKLNIEMVKSKGCKILLDETFKTKKIEDIEKNMTKIMPVQPKRLHPQMQGSLNITEDEASYFNTSRFIKHGKTGRDFKFENQQNNGKLTSDLDHNSGRGSPVDRSELITGQHSSNSPQPNMLERHKYENSPNDYFYDMASNYICENGHDIVPEFFYGKNISDFIHEDIHENFNLLENEELNKQETLRKYDILTRDERLYVEEIRVRQRAKEIEHSMKSRSTLPQKWLDNRSEKESEDLTTYSNVVQREPERIKRNTFMKTEYRRYYDKKPRHLNVSSRGKKGALYSFLCQ